MTSQPGGPDAALPDDTHAPDVDRTGGGTVYTDTPPDGEDDTRDQSLVPDVPTVLPPPAVTGAFELVDPPAELTETVDEPAISAPDVDGPGRPRS